MFNYLAFIHHGIKEAREDAYSAGRELASACLAQLQRLDNPDQFPPKLFILLASPAYVKAERVQSLLDGVHHGCEEYEDCAIPLIGSTVDGVIFDRHVHKDGCLLICLASRMLEAKLAVGEGARNDPERAVDQMLEQLGLSFSGADKDPNPLVNRLLFTFFPGSGDVMAGQCSPGRGLHRHLRNQMRARVQIVGGGSSGGDQNSTEMQFLGKQVFVDAIVSARLATGFPFASSIGHGLTPTESIYHIHQLDSDKRTILRFEEGVPAEALKLVDPDDFQFLGQWSRDNDSLVTTARLTPDNSGAVQTMHEMTPNSSLEVLNADVKQIRGEVSKLIAWSLGRGPIENPIGIIGIHSTAQGQQFPV